ncbi:MAG: isoprenylcysteine carboxylmethyltransferase family protein [Phycisphaerae bacterium]|jgi:protein-S-isoprenylcysteine O-methyltransferase Ste14|nr:isoprenylcysteine carboxylmethyltransferase family protein [Phycisphaerae bacterium]
MSTDRTSPDKDAPRSLMGKIGRGVVKVLTLFVILEPIWMLLPFAGFLYGSVLQIQTLNRNPQTSWLTHFVFPVLTLGWLGPVLVVGGLLVFLIGAGQIYWAKIRRSGIVTGGLYRLVRHPQYIALTMFGLGLLLAWGRAIMFIAFFMMMFLYYYLTKSEERTCIRLFGDDYREYRKRTSFIFPGDRFLRSMRDKLPGVKLPAPARITGAFVLTMVLCFALMWVIQTIKIAYRTVPYLTEVVDLGPVRDASLNVEMTSGRGGGIPFVQAGRIAVVRGPYRNASASGLAEHVLQRARQSARLDEFLDFLDTPGADVAIVFCGPYDPPRGVDDPGPGMYAGGAPGGRGPGPDPHGADRVRLILMRCTLAPQATIADALDDKSKRTIVGGCVARVDLARPEDQDIVVGQANIAGPGFPGEDRWDYFFKQFSRLPRAAERPPALALPGRYGKGRLVLVKAPILRTRIDPGFAAEIRDRLVASATFRSRLRKAGLGGPVVAVAFPRPGPNWYREHHGTPQLSLFVMMVRLESGANTDDLFHPSRRELLSAFIISMDFAIDPPADSVGEATMIGLWRDLEERWRFFLSGLGAESMQHSHP